MTAWSSALMATSRRSSAAIKGRLIVKIASSKPDLPLYEVMQKARGLTGSAIEVVIRTEEEPIYRQFFLQLAELCSRPVVLL
jgi:hypothetical protein